MEWQLIYQDGKTLWRRTLESGEVEEREATPDSIDAAEALLDQQGWERYDREIAAIKAEKAAETKQRPHEATGFDTADLDGQ